MILNIVSLNVGRHVIYNKLDTSPAKIKI